MEHESTDFKTKTTSVSAIPTYHWSEIASPRYRDLSISLLSTPVSVTQKVHRRNETPKTTKAHSAFVIYDSDFVKYKLLEVVAPFLSEYFQNSDEDGIELDVIHGVNSEVVTALLHQLNHSIVYATNTHVRTVRACGESGFKGETESEKIKARFDFLQTQFSNVCEFTDLYDLASQIVSINEGSDTLSADKLTELSIVQLLDLLSIILGSK